MCVLVCVFEIKVVTPSSIGKTSLWTKCGTLSLLQFVPLVETPIQKWRENPTTTCKWCTRKSTYGLRFIHLVFLLTKNSVESKTPSTTTKVNPLSKSFVQSSHLHNILLTKSIIDSPMRSPRSWTSLMFPSSLVGPSVYRRRGISWTTNW